MRCHTDSRWYQLFIHIDENKLYKYDQKGYGRVAEITGRFLEEHKHWIDSSNIVTFLLISLC